MDNLIKDSATLEFSAWLVPGCETAGWDIPKGNPFGAAFSSPESGTSSALEQSAAVQSYFAEYHLEYFRQRRFNDFPCRLHASILFATRTDALTFQHRHPDQVVGKQLVGARTKGPYICSFHDASWLDYLRLPHSLSLSALDEVAEHYWSGRTVEEAGLYFMDEPWREPPVIEALFQGNLEPDWDNSRTGWLPALA